MIDISKKFKEINKREKKLFDAVIQSIAAFKMMVIKCYVCNSATDDWRSNLIGLKSQHSNVLVTDLLKKVLNGFQSMRNIDDELNCICIDCLSKIEDYDWICLRAKQSEKDLYNILIQTENGYMTKLSEIDSKTVLIDAYEVAASTSNLRTENDATVDTQNIVEPEMISVNEMFDVKTSYNDLDFDDEQIEMNMSYEKIGEKYDARNVAPTIRTSFKICNPIDVGDAESEFIGAPEIGGNVKRSVGRPRKSPEMSYECTECRIVFEKRDDFRVRYFLD